METARLKPNTTQIPNFFLDVLMRDLTDTELRILLYIARQTYGWIEDLKTKKRKEKDWIAYSQLIEKTGRQSQAISQALKGLREKGLIEVLDQEGNLIRTKEEAIGKKLFYRIKTSLKIKEDNSNLFENQSLKIKDTKETNTKTVTNVTDDVRPKGRLSCPLRDFKNPLSIKWPRGHKECEEYVLSLKFVNKGKQFRFLHQMLRVGLDFPDIDKLINRIEKKPYYQENGWDFATIASEADRRVNASP